MILERHPKSKDPINFPFLFRFPLSYGILFVRPNSLHQTLNLNTNMWRAWPILYAFPDSDYTVSVTSVADTIMCPKQKLSRSMDRIHALHIKNGSLVLLEHLTLLLHNFYARFGSVNILCGELSSIPRKWKTSNQCTSFRPITVSTSLCKFIEDCSEKTSKKNVRRLYVNLSFNMALDVETLLRWLLMLCLMLHVQVIHSHWRVMMFAASLTPWSAASWF